MRLADAVRRATGKVATPADPAIGSAFGGGYYVGKMRYDGFLHWLVVADKASEKKISPTLGGTATLRGEYDGKANTALLPASAIKSYVTGYVDSQGNNDYYLPANFEIELAYRFLKPTTFATNTNSVASSIGGTGNLQSVPLGYQYTASQRPLQTEVPLFRQNGGAQAFFEDGSEYFLTSTGNPSTSASTVFALCRFTDGFKASAGNTTARYIRPFRRILIPGQ